MKTKEHLEKHDKQIAAIRDLESIRGANSRLDRIEGFAKTIKNIVGAVLWLIVAILR